MFKTFLISIYLFFISSSGWANQRPFLVLSPGEMVRLKTSRGSRIFVGNGNVIGVKDLGTEILITGKKQGQTTLTTDEKIYEVRVASNETSAAWKGLYPLTQRFEGLHLELKDSMVTVTGELLRMSDWQDLKKTALEKNISWLFDATVDPDLKPLVKKNIETILLAAGIPTPNIRFPKSVKVSLPTLSQKQSELAQSLLEPWGLALSQDESLLKLEPLIEVEIEIAEVKRASFSRVGIQWPTTYSATVLPGASTTAADQGFQELSGASTKVLLHAMEEEGNLKILASPRLLCRSGKEAQFLAGGEFPIKIVNFKVNDVIWKKYGVLLNIKPTADRQGRMSIEIETEVSTLDTSHTVDGVPGLLTNRIKSHFDLVKSRTVALSGLLKEETGRSKNGIAGLGNIPIIGALFTSKDYLENKTELVVFVTPRLIGESEQQK